MTTASDKSILIIFLGGKFCHNKHCPVPRHLLHDNCLQIAHKYDDGTIDRLRFSQGHYSWSDNRVTGYLAPMLKYYLKNLDEAQEKLKVLCVYCNWYEHHALRLKPLMLWLFKKERKHLNLT
jgi:hypothetical protein